MYINFYSIMVNKFRHNNTSVRVDRAQLNHIKYSLLMYFSRLHGVFNASLDDIVYTLKLLISKQKVVTALYNINIHIVRI